jgi:salicylate hydroxylase
MYPCRDMEEVNFTLTVPDTMLRQATSQSWTLDGDLDEMKAHFSDFPEWLQLIFT